MSDSLTNLILSLTPEDGSSVGNGAMMELLKEKMRGITLDDYIAARDELIDDGLIGRGRGRGGSIFRELDGSDSDEDDHDVSADMEGFDERRRPGPMTRISTRC
jgi:adenine-specific DNA-methyltransferase